MATGQTISPTKRKHIKTSEKVVHWLIFGVVMALVPFAAAFFGDVDRGVKLHSATLFGKGELLIVAAVIAAGAIGDLFGTEVRETRKVPKLIVLGFCVISLVATSLWFADISSLILSPHPANPQEVAAGSMAFFGFTVAIGLSALLLAEA